MKITNEAITDRKIIRTMDKFTNARNRTKHSLNFIGVFMRDEVSDKSVIKQMHIDLSVDNAIVINLDEAKDDGTHWVALYFYLDSANTLVVKYFDPYGLEPFPEIKAFVKKLASPTQKYKFYYSNLDVQAYDFTGRKGAADSALCGYYCLAWIVLMFDRRNHALEFVRGDFNANRKTLQRILRDY